MAGVLAHGRTQPARRAFTHFGRPLITTASRPGPAFRPARRRRPAADRIRQLGGTYASFEGDASCADDVRTLTSRVAGRRAGSTFSSATPGEPARTLFR